jgi:hypothetical protein
MVLPRSLSFARSLRSHRWLTERGSGPCSHWSVEAA